MKLKQQIHSLTPTGTVNDLYEVQKAQSPNGRDRSFPVQTKQLIPTPLVLTRSESKNNCNQELRFISFQVKTLTIFYTHSEMTVTHFLSLFFLTTRKTIP